MKRLVFFVLVIVFRPLISVGQSDIDPPEGTRIYNDAKALIKKGVNYYDLAKRKLGAAIGLNPDLEDSANNLIAKINVLQNAEKERAVLNERLSGVRQLEQLASSIGDNYPDRKVLILLEALRRNKNETSNESALEQEILRDLKGYYNSWALRHHWLRSFAISSDGRWLAIGGGDSVVHLWDLQRDDSNFYVLPEPANDTRELKFSPDGQWLVAVSDSRPLRAVWLNLFNMRDLAAPATQFKLIGESLKKIAFSANGFCAALFQNGIFKLYQLHDQSWEPAFLKTDTFYRVQCFSFNEDGGLLVTGDEAGRVVMWNTRSLLKEPLIIPNASRKKVEAVSFSPNSKWLVATYDQKAKDSVIGRFAKGAILWTINGAMSTLKTDTLVVNSSVAPEIVFSGDSKWLIINGHESFLRLWHLPDAIDPSPIRKYDHKLINEGVSVVRFSPDNTLLAFGTSGVGTSTGGLRIWNLRNPADAISILTGHTGSITDLAFSPDNNKLYSASADWTVRIWNTRFLTTAPIILRGHEGAVDKLLLFGQNLITVSLYRNGNNEASGSLRFYVLLPDYTPRPLENIAYVPEFSQNVQISSDDHWMGFSGNADAYLLSLTEFGAEPIKIPGWLPNPRKGIFSPRAKWVLTADFRDLSISNPDKGVSTTFSIREAGDQKYSSVYDFDREERRLAVSDLGNKVYLFQLEDSGIARIADTILVPVSRGPGKSLQPGVVFDETGNYLLVTDSIAILYKIDDMGKATKGIRLETDNETVVGGIIVRNKVILVTAKGNLFTGGTFVDEEGKLTRVKASMNGFLPAGIKTVVSEDRKWLVISAGGYCYLWKMDIPTPFRFKIISGKDDPARNTSYFIKDISFSGDNKWVAVITGMQVRDQLRLHTNYRIRLIDVAGGVPVEKPLPFARDNQYGECKFSPDSKWLAIRETDFQRPDITTSIPVALLSLTDHRPIPAPYMLYAQDHAISYMCFSRDSKLLFTSSADQSIVKCTIENRQPEFIQ
jgi:WD40 repeat protein